MLYDKKVKERALKEIEKYGPAPTHFAIVRMAGSNKSVLELGCATGYVSQMLKSNGCSVTGVELDSEAAETARLFCDCVIVADLGKPEFLEEMEEKFDCVLCGDILEHLPEPDKVLILCRKLLKPEGSILVSLPNIAYWKMRWDLLMGRFNYQDTGLLDRTHLRFFTVNTFTTLIEECGYIITETEINEAGFPGSQLLDRIPIVRGLIQLLSRWFAGCFPNFFIFHAIYRLEIRKENNRIDERASIA